MADHLILVNVGDASDAERILTEFEERTGLDSEPVEGGRLYDLTSSDHEVDVVQTLTDIDEGWTEVVGLKDPG